MPEALRAVFCDSVAELGRLVASERADKLWGVRLRLPGWTSRFGVALDDVDELERVSALVRRMPPARAFGVPRNDSN